MEIFISVGLGILLGAFAVFLIWKLQSRLKEKSIQAEVNRIINRAKNEAAKIEREARNKVKEFETKARKNIENELQKLKSNLKAKEQQLEKRLKDIEFQEKKEQERYRNELNKLEQKEMKIQQMEARLQEQKAQLDKEIEEVRIQLARVSNMSEEEARRLLMDSLVEDAKKMVASKIDQIQKEAEKEAELKAQKIIASAMARFATEFTSERTVTVMTLESEELKGKIIGREGRNIRTLEALCGVDLIVDDTPEAVVISGFDPIRRELAKRSIEKLLEDGRVHPARIEEVVEKQRVELQKSIKDEGEKAVEELAIGSVHPEIARLIGSMKYRHTQTQNLLNHSMEVAYLAGVLAGDFGVDVRLARRAGLLHDIGKCVDHTFEGSHAVVGADFIKKLGESEAIVHAVRAHHNDEPPSSILAHIVICANMISNSRPGARRPGMDNYVKRHAELESIANSFDGVVRSYAVQAGREIRVMVEASVVTEDLSRLLARDILKKIERELPHVNPIKVVVIRELRSVEFAR
ncbi:MAG: ribonuclease Y [Bdellovibrionaceae bacterium]|nr:ribonuclease Y [Pseudobdellovibrionaceae bacterium]MDW8190515.1 ribonuclease Y [Pseudobdellovibrionaceae bacterium]